MMPVGYRVGRVIPKIMVEDSKGGEILFSHTISPPDPFAPRQKSFKSSFFNAVLATALFRCWHILLFFTGWATAVTIISARVHSLAIQPTVLTVIGTVLGFVISYRTTSSFERYNEGRRYWSQIILASRTFARLVWFHVPQTMPPAAGWENMPESERQARTLIEKKTVINLLEAFAASVKHYLRGEDGIYYTDLYHLVKFLPAYALPAGIPSVGDLSMDLPHSPGLGRPSISEVINNDTNGVTPTQLHFPDGDSSQRPSTTIDNNLPLPNTTSGKKTNFSLQPPPSPRRRPRAQSSATKGGDKEKMSVISEDGFLFPASMPPKYHLFDLFPFSLLVRLLAKRGKEVKGKKAARLRAKMRNAAVSHNLPLEISLYLSSYISALQNRKALDPPITTNLIATQNQLVDALTGLERILTTPIPFSYAIHLWVVTIIYCLMLPFQLYGTLKWVTIPATSIASFMFFGFIVAGEEIENPFGYDKNDLNLDHFTSNIIRNELRALTATSPPNPNDWAFSDTNNLVFSARHGGDDERVTPEEWVSRGVARMQGALVV